NILFPATAPLISETTAPTAFTSQSERRPALSSWRIRMPCLQFIIGSASLTPRAVAAPWPTTFTQRRLAVGTRDWRRAPQRVAGLSLGFDADDPDGNRHD